MLHKKQLTCVLHAFSQYALWAATALMFLVACIQKLDRQKLWGDWYFELRGWCVSSSWWMLALGSAVVFFCKLIPAAIGNPKAWDYLHDYLDTWREDVFRSVSSGGMDHHRVTLFKTQVFRPWLGECLYRVFLHWWFPLKPKWLVPVVRSSHTGQQTTTVFRINDDGDKCLGVAGRAWADSKVVQVYDLPLISSSSKRQDYKAYASKSFLEHEWVKAKQPKTRSILAIPIRVKGEMWGVLVFDSRDPEKIAYSGHEGLYALIAKQLSSLIEKVL